MLVTFPRSIMLDPSGFGDMNQLLTFGLDGPGLNGLGQCISVIDGSDVDCSSSEAGGAGSGIAPITSGTVTFPTITDLGPSTVGSGDYIPPAQTACVGVNCGAPAASTTIGAQSTVAQDLAAIGPALTAASKALATATGPYAIPGTSYIYNPATGQILLGNTPIGTYNPSTGVASALTSSLLSYLPLIIIAVIGMSFLGGKK